MTPDKHGRKLSVFCVLDGHSGSEAADFCVSELPKLLKTQLNTLKQSPSSFFKQGKKQTC
jgi:serine/threonine protein phosphatase PrpC